MNKKMEKFLFLEKLFYFFFHFIFFYFLQHTCVLILYYDALLRILFLPLFELIKNDSRLTCDINNIYIIYSGIHKHSQFTSYREINCHLFNENCIFPRSITSVKVKFPCYKFPHNLLYREFHSNFLSKIRYYRMPEILLIKTSLW